MGPVHLVNLLKILFRAITTPIEINSYSQYQVRLLFLLQVNRITALKFNEGTSNT